MKYSSAIFFGDYCEIPGGYMKTKLMEIKKHQASLLLFAGLITGLLILYFIFDILGKVSPNSYRPLTNITVDVAHKDGTVDYFNSHLFNFTSKDDVITIHLHLDEESKQKHQSVNFFFYNSVVKAYYKDRLLASYGENLKRHMIGKLKISIPIPSDAFGDEIRIVIHPTLDILEDTFKPPLLMSEADASFYPIIGLEASYTLFIVILIFSFLGIVVFTFLYRTFDFAREGTWLMALIFAITLWFVGNSGMIYLLTANEDLNAPSEYIGMYLLFTTAPLYASFETERPLLKKYLKISGSILLGFSFLCFVLYILPTGFTYVWALRQVQTLQIVMVFSSLVSLLSPGKKHMNLEDYVMRIGLTTVALFGLLEQIRIIISAQVTETWPAFMQMFIKMHFSIALILAMVVTLYSSYFIKVKYILQKNLREKHLEILAYTDNLTTLGNRQYLQRKLNILDSKNNKNYAVIFIDINDLKYANDTFGHEAGDQLIKMVASSIKDAMEDSSDGFVGRNGGDEFICVVIPSIDADSIAKKIKDNLILAREHEKPPFPVSISLGIANYSELAGGEQGSIDSSDVIKLADERMYADKCIQKKNRKLPLQC